MAEKYIIQMQILETKKEKDLDVATKVAVQLQLTDPTLSSKRRVERRPKKDSLYAAMDVAAVWLDRALAGKIITAPIHQRLLQSERTENEFVRF